jgi:hypothetical protein
MQDWARNLGSVAPSTMRRDKTILHRRKSRTDFTKRAILNWLGTAMLIGVLAIRTHLWTTKNPIKHA